MRLGSVRRKGAGTSSQTLQYSQQAVHQIRGKGSWKL